jgi:hypothetical protein
MTTTGLTGNLVELKNRGVNGRVTLQAAIATEVFEAE